LLEAVQLQLVVRENEVVPPAAETLFAVGDIEREQAAWVTVTVTGSPPAMFRVMVAVLGLQVVFTV